MDLDLYLTETITIIRKKKIDVDEFSLNSDLKQYILNESEHLSKIRDIDINTAVDNVISSLGSPEEFALKVLAEVQGEKRYLIYKIIIASFLAFFPFIILLLVLLRIL